MISIRILTSHYMSGVPKTAEIQECSKQYFESNKSSVKQDGRHK